MKHGVEAKDYTSLMKSEHLTPLETNIRKARDQLTIIYDEMIDAVSSPLSLLPLSFLSPLPSPLSPTLANRCTPPHISFPDR
jgi:hypothetical protein